MNNYIIIDSFIGYGISKRDKRYPGRRLYFGGYRNQVPMWYTDFTYTRWFRTEKTLRKHIERLHEVDYDFLWR